MITNDLKSCTKQARARVILVQAETMASDKEVIRTAVKRFKSLSFRRKQPAECE